MKKANYSYIILLHEIDPSFCCNMSFMTFGILRLPSNRCLVTFLPSQSFPSSLNTYPLMDPNQCCLSKLKNQFRKFSKLFETSLDTIKSLLKLIQKQFRKCAGVLKGNSDPNSCPIPSHFHLDSILTLMLSLW